MRTQRIKIRSCLCPGPAEKTPKLSIEMNGQTLPLADEIEIEGQLIATTIDQTPCFDYSDRSPPKKRGKPLFL